MGCGHATPAKLRGYALSVDTGDPGQNLSRGMRLVSCPGSKSERMALGDQSDEPTLW